MDPFLHGGRGLVSSCAVRRSREYRSGRSGFQRGCVDVREFSERTE
jgi:hypothetical protein